MTIKTPGSPNTASKKVVKSDNKKKVPKETQDSAQINSEISQPSTSQIVETSDNSSSSPTVPPQDIPKSEEIVQEQHEVTSELETTEEESISTQELIIENEESGPIEQAVTNLREILNRARNVDEIRKGLEGLKHRTNTICTDVEQIKQDLQLFGSMEKTIVGSVNQELTKIGELIPEKKQVGIMSEKVETVLETLQKKEEFEKSALSQTLNEKFASQSRKFELHTLNMEKLNSSISSETKIVSAIHEKVNGIPTIKEFTKKQDVVNEKLQKSQELLKEKQQILTERQQTLYETVKEIKSILSNSVSSSQQDKQGISVGIYNVTNSVKSIEKSVNERVSFLKNLLIIVIVVLVGVFAMSQFEKSSLKDQLTEMNERMEVQTQVIRSILKQKEISPVQTRMDETQIDIKKNDNPMVMNIDDVKEKILKVQVDDVVKTNADSPKVKNPSPVVKEDLFETPKKEEAKENIFESKPKEESPKPVPVHEIPIIKEEIKQSKKQLKKHEPKPKKEKKKGKEPKKQMKKEEKLPFDSKEKLSIYVHQSYHTENGKNPMALLQSSQYSLKFQTESNDETKCEVKFLYYDGRPQRSLEDEIDRHGSYKKPTLLIVCVDDKAEDFSVKNTYGDSNLFIARGYDNFARKGDWSEFESPVNKFLEACAN